MALKSILRTALERVLARWGYELKDKALPLRRPDAFFSVLRERGYRPTTVFDIGVGFGTPWLYEAFPEAFFVLIEANGDFEPSLMEIAKRYRVEYHVTALGAQTGRANLRVNRCHPTSSSLLPLTERHAQSFTRRAISMDLEARDVGVVPLDSLLSGTVQPPFMIKLDVEGFELEVLKGAARTLADTELLVTELSVRDRFQGEAGFAPFIAFMEKLGFALFDIVDLKQSDRRGPLTYMDAVFVQRGSRLWQN